MIATGNVVALNAIKGIGTKTAQRIIVDLKDKIIKNVGGGEFPNAAVNTHSEQKEEAVSALVMLGFASAASQKVVDRIFKRSTYFESGATNQVSFENVVKFLYSKRIT